MRDTSPRVIEFFVDDLVILRRACTHLDITPAGGATPAYQIRMTLTMPADDLAGCLRRLVVAKLVNASLMLDWDDGLPPAVLHGTIQNICHTLTADGHILVIDFVEHDPDHLPTH